MFYRTVMVPDNVFVMINLVLNMVILVCDLNLEEYVILLCDGVLIRIPVIFARFQIYSNSN